MKRQVFKEFLPHVGNRSDWAQWSPNDTLFVSWIGINDCGRNIWNPHKGAQSSINELFELYDQLYQSGARNFCLIDVPPLHEYPGRLESSQLKEAYSAWNPLLHAGAQLFISAHDDVTVMIYSSWDFFSRLLKDPVAFGFSEADLRSPRSAIFVDGTHPTTEVHAIIAQELLALWKSIQPQKADTPLPNM
ncbi:hypothetical protein AX16_004963 [Volvariella volvacea WC 439]|nr:hypothetical protein AX16_004963 [Volvariella volvacea WC 439]